MLTQPAVATQRRLFGVSLTTVLALFSVWIVWGTVYIFVRYAIQTIPVLMMNGTRFIAAGLCLLAVLRWQGMPWPTLRQARNAALLGFLLNALCQGSVAMAQLYIPAGMAAVIVATSPFWIVLAAVPVLGWPGRAEWIGIAIGFAGVMLLIREPSLVGQPLGIGLVIFGMVIWAVGSALARKLDLPKGMMSTAVQLCCGGVILTAISLLAGERWPAQISLISGISWVYLVFIGSILGFGSYLYTLKHVRPALASAYAYINPLVALGLSALLFGETVSAQGVLAIAVILSGVIFMSRGRR